MPSALVFAGMMAALDGCFTYSLTTLGLITVILFGITSALSVCSFSMFFILRVKFDRHQMLAIIISFGLMAATVITFLLLKLNASDAVQHPYRYVPLYQGNKPQE
ncbi:hypothetical protein FACS1894166_11100 [Bacilli bacterium]|nr:hypothetical protein FACS1894166_11100 [Bacilli bacterium]